jgi:flagellar biosynthesis protein FlhF
MGQRFFKVRGRSLDDAYARLRKQFGDDAVVLGTHQATEGGLWRWFGRTVVEVTAAVPAELLRPPGAPQRKPTPAERAYAANSAPPRDGADPAAARNAPYYEQILREAHARIQGEVPPAAPARAAAPAPAPASAAPRAGGGEAAPVLPFPQRSPGAPETAGAVGRELQQIREMVQVLYAENPGAGLPTEFAPHYRTLVERGVSRKIAAALIGAVVKDADPDLLRDPRLFLERLHMEMRRIVHVTGELVLSPGKRRVVALCGPTGVGKTTNLAKLAAHYTVRARARVALITADTYRIAAPEQLRTYANIIGLPMQVVNDPREMAEALHNFRAFDLVLIDTAGGSQYNLEQINELKGLLAAAQPHETLLVLGAGAQPADLRTVVSNFKCLNPTALLFTKLDETSSYGAILSLLIESALPLAYLSVGQGVPDDIRPATPGLVANLILEGRRYPAG